jgi:lysylphosphatidylglycerol synthetase-like protein (DUF2156 family)
MVETNTAETRGDWKLPLSLVAASTIGLLLLIVYTAYFFVWIPIIATIVGLSCLILMVTAAIRKRLRQIILLLLATVAFVAMAAVFDKGGDSLRSYLRWLLWSRRFKAEVLAQPAPSNGELRHMVWEETGFAGVANVTSYIAFDPSDALSNAHLPGKVAGIPCTVLRAFRLERHWYSVWFYTDETWSECPWSNKAAAELRTD